MGGNRRLDGLCADPGPEASGVTQANVDAMLKSEEPVAPRWLLDDLSGLARALGLDADWAVRAIKAVGTYGELFDCTLGKSSPLESAAWQERLMDAGWADVPDADPVSRLISRHELPRGAAARANRSLIASPKPSEGIGATAMRSGPSASSSCKK